ncbi:MAG TPA: hypothetical protein VGW34_06230 [Allosphingosinicella sp.]|nr:hypothetical protein [Allosphingosinicella sp.]
MRKMLLLASAAAMAISLPADASGQDRRDRDAPRGQAKAAAKARANAREANVRAEARGDNRARTAVRARAKADTRAEVRRDDAQDKRAQQRRRDAANDRDAQEQRQRSAARERRAQEERQQAAQEQRRQAAVRDRAQDRRAADQRQDALARENFRDRMAREQRQDKLARENFQDRMAREQREDVLARQRFQNRLQEQRLDARVRQRLSVSRDPRYAATIRARQRDRWLAAQQRFRAEQARRLRLAAIRDAAPLRYAYRQNPRYRQLAAYYGVGRNFPLSTYRSYNVPLRFRSIYYDTPNSFYRYGDGFIYRVNPYTNLVAGAIPLFGGAFAVGRPIPLGYDVYNVPLQYRDVYYDTPSSFYRYGDGGIYRVDPTTGLIAGVVALLAGDFTVGSPLPVGYGAYNLPLQYRDHYVDGPDYLYRYNDGYIYQVDAETMLIHSAISALV